MTVTVTQGERRELQEVLVETLGTKPADTMMSYLPPVGWADVATKADLDQLAAATKADLATLETVLTATLSAQMDQKLKTQFYWTVMIMIALLSLQGAAVISIIKLT